MKTLKIVLFALPLISTLSVYASGSDKELGRYYHDGCSKKVSDQGMDGANAYLCNDGSITYQQPDSEKAFGYEGKCGQTAAQNLLHMHCKLLSDSDYMDDHFSDYTPGVRASTLTDGLNKLFDKHPNDCAYGLWDFYTASNRWDFYDSIYNHLRGTSVQDILLEKGKTVKRSPVAVLLSTKGKVLHWVTVVNMIGYDPNNMKSVDNANCQIYANSWGAQYKIPCNDFADMANHVSSNSVGVSGNYTRIVFEPLKKWNEYFPSAKAQIENSSPKAH